MATHTAQNTGLMEARPTATTTITAMHRIGMEAALSSFLMAIMTTRMNITTTTITMMGNVATTATSANIMTRGRKDQGRRLRRGAQSRLRLQRAAASMANLHAVTSEDGQELPPRSGEVRAQAAAG